MKHVVDVIAVRSRRLKERTAEFSGQSQPFLLGDLSQQLQIRLVSHKNHRCVIRTANTINELLKLPDFMETSTVSDGVTDDKPFSGPHVLIPHGRELCLSSRVQNVQIGRLIIDPDPDFISIFDGGVVVLREPMADELHGHSTLPHAASAQHHQFVFPREARGAAAAAAPWAGSRIHCLRGDPRAAPRKRKAPGEKEQHGEPRLVARSDSPRAGAQCPYPGLALQLPAGGSPRPEDTSPPEPSLPGGSVL